MDRVFLNADRLNGEPPIFRGCSSSELVALAVLAFVTWVPLGLLLGLLVGAPIMGIGFAGIAIIGSVFVSATLLQKLKRGRPDHDYWHRFLIRLEALGLRRSGFIRREGTWDLGRSFWP
jgi:conjugative transfer region protein (TIGR03750 family)